MGGQALSKVAERCPEWLDGEQCFRVLGHDGEHSTGKHPAPDTIFVAPPLRLVRPDDHIIGERPWPWEVDD